MADFNKVEGSFCKTARPSTVRHASNVLRGARRRRQTWAGFNQPDALIIYLEAFLNDCKGLRTWKKINRTFDGEEIDDGM